jgi:MFS family permease
MAEGQKQLSSMAEGQKKAFTVAIVSVLFTEGCAGVAGMMFQPIVPIFMRTKGLSAFQTTLMSLTPMLAGGVFTALNGVLSDKFGRKRVMQVNLVFQIFVYILMSRCSSILSFVVAFLCIGACTSIDAPVSAYVMENAEEEFLPRVLSAKTTVKALSSACGAGVGAILFKVGGWSGLCLSMSACAALSFIMGSLFWSSAMPEKDPTPAESDHQRGDNAQGDSADGSREAPAKSIGALLSHFIHPDRGVLMWVGVLSISGLMPPFLLTPFILQDKYHYTASAYANYIGGFMLSMFFFTQFSEWQIRFLGCKTCIGLSNVLTGVAVLWLLCAAPTGWSWAPYPMYLSTAFLVAQNNGAQILLSSVTPPDLRGEVFGVCGAVCAMVAGCAGPGGAYLYDICWWAPFVVSVVFFGLTLPLVPLIKDAKLYDEPLLSKEGFNNTP